MLFSISFSWVAPLLPNWFKRFKINCFCFIISLGYSKRHMGKKYGWLIIKNMQSIKKNLQTSFSKISNYDLLREISKTTGIVFIFGMLSLLTTLKFNLILITLLKIYKEKKLRYVLLKVLFHNLKVALWQSNQLTVAITCMYIS